MNHQDHKPSSNDRLQGKVVVITGASSGLGRECAVQFAARGCTVVIAGRRADALQDTARECRAVGGHAIWQVTDVTVEDQVHQLAAAALAPSGAIDVWINNAGVTCFSRLEDGPFDEHRRVIETNLYGAIYGARAVVPIFRRQRRGVLINVGSVLSKIGQPFVPSYVISKFGLRGMSEALRAELADQPDIFVCSVHPYAMDTQHFESGANHYGRSAHPMPPLQSPEKVARVVVDLAMRPRRERHVPRAAVIGLALHALAPRSTERVIFEALRRWHFGTEPQSGTAGNLFWPKPVRGTVHGSRQPVVGGLQLWSWALARLCATPFAALSQRLRRSALGSPPGERAEAEPLRAATPTNGHGKEGAVHV